MTRSCDKVMWRLKWMTTQKLLTLHISWLDSVEQDTCKLDAIAGTLVVICTAAIKGHLEVTSGSLQCWANDVWYNCKQVMCVWVCVYRYVCMGMCVWVCMYGHVCMGMYVWVCMYGYVCMGMYVWVCVYGLCVWVCMYGYGCMGMCVWVCVYGYAHRSVILWDMKLVWG